MAIAVEVLSDSKQAQQDLAQLRKSVDNIQTTANTASNAIRGFLSSISAMAVSAITIGSVAKASDELTTLTSKIKLATKTQDEFNYAVRETRQIASATRQSLTSITSLYNRVAIATDNLGVSQKDVVKFTDSVAKAVAASGSSAQEASAAIIQLGQALSSGRLSGDELRSISENAAVLYRTIAEGMGVSIGQMKILGEQGKLTSAEVFKAVLSQADKLEEKFGKIEITYGQAFTNLGNSFIVLFDKISKVFVGDSRGLAAYINDIAVAVSKFANNFEHLMLRIGLEFIRLAYDTEKFFQKLPENFNKSFDKIKNKTIDFSIKLKEFNIAEYLIKLQPIVDKVKHWVFQIERAFFWLYDKVIGHSWVPDLVDGVNSEFEKLNKAESFLIRWARRANEVFKKLTIDSPIGQWVARQIQAIEKAGYGHTVRQILGKKDPYAGSYKDVNSPTGYSAIDTEANVGRGPKRNNDIRPVFHDILNAFPTTWQIPILAGMTTVFTGALMLAFKSSEARLAIVGLTTTAFGLGVAQLVDNKEIERFTSNLIDKVRSGFSMGIKGLFGEGIFGDLGPGGALALIAKLALLFKSGREAAWSMSKAILTSPTKGVQALGDALESKWVKNTLKNVHSQIVDLPAKSNEKLQRANEELRKAIVDLARSRDISGAKVGLSTAKQFAAGTIPQSQIGLIGEQTRAFQRIAAAQESVAASNKAISQLPQKISELKASQVELAKDSKSLEKRVFETKEAFKAGVKNVTGGIGGTLGTLYGFNLGSQIAEGMTGYSGWAKVGVQMAFAFAGQAVFASIGVVIGHSILSVLGAIGLVIAQPIVLAIAGIAATIIGAFYIIKNWEWFKDFISDLSQVGKIWLNDLWQGFLKLWKPKDYTEDERKKFSADLEKAKEDYKKKGYGTANPAQFRGETLSGNLKAGIEKIFDLFISKADAAQNIEINITEKRNQINSQLDEVFKKVDPSKRLETFLESITKFEGIKYGFNTNFGNKEISDLAQHPNRVGEFKVGNTTTSAAGAFQFQRGTWDEIASKLGLSDFSGENQIKAAIELIKRAGAMADVLAGNFTSASEKLSKIWEGLPSSPKFIKNISYLEKAPEKLNAAIESVKNGTSLVGSAISDSATSLVKTSDKLMTDAGKKIYDAGDSFISLFKGGDFSFSNIVDILMKKIGAKVDTAKPVDVKLPEMPAEAKLPEPPKNELKYLSGALNRAGNQQQILDTINKFLADLNLVGLQVTNIESIDTEKLKHLIDNIDNVAELTEKAADTSVNAYTRLMAKSQASRFKKYIDDLVKEINFTPQAGKESFSANALAFGVDFAKQTQDSFHTGLTSALGSKAPLKEIVKGFVDTFTMSIINGFSRGLSETLFKSLGIDKFLTDLGTRVFDLGEKTGKSPQTVFSLAVDKFDNIVNKMVYGNTEYDSFDFNPGQPGAIENEKNLLKQAQVLTNANNEQKGIFETSWESLKNILTGNGSFIEKLSASFNLFGDILSRSWNSFSGILSSFGDSFSNIISSVVSGVGGFGGSLFDGIDGIFGSLFAAEGGLIKGAGSGVSDSINAFLSNGEYVVNAASTKKFLPLLDAINSNKLEGIPVSGIDTSSKIDGRNINSSQQIFNIQITGDISRQTKKEIMGLLPQIATGVNFHNKEIGYRG